VAFQAPDMPLPQALALGQDPVIVAARQTNIAAKLP
jgi:hypothetical protein